MATAEIPLMETPRLEMLKALEDDSYYELSLLVSRHGPVYPHNTHMSAMAQAASKILLDRSNKRVLSVLLHCIPANLMKSIIRGTVAFDFDHANRPSPDCYSSDGPGAYVAALSILRAGSNGRFLSTVEMLKLISSLEKYCQCYLRQKAHDGTPGTAADIVLHNWAKSIDTAYGSRPKKDPNKLRFIPSDSALKSVRELIGGFKRRCDVAIAKSFNKNVWLAQGPLMVGCTNDMTERMKHHSPHESGLQGTTYTWALTICCIKADLDLDPATTVRPVLRTWENAHLNFAEVLVTALARSYCFQDGFNVLGAGTHGGDRGESELLECKKYVLSRKPYFDLNIEATMDELDKRIEYSNNVLLCETYPDQNVEHDVEKIGLEVQALKTEASELRNLRRDATRLIERLDNRLEDKEREIRMLSSLEKVFDVLLQPPRPMSSPVRPSPVRSSPVQHGTSEAAETYQAMDDRPIPASGFGYDAEDEKEEDVDTDSASGRSVYAGNDSNLESRTPLNARGQVIEVPCSEIEFDEDSVE